jgi:hypothetical protein
MFVANMSLPTVNRYPDMMGINLQVQAHNAFQAYTPGSGGSYFMVSEDRLDVNDHDQLR